MSASDSNGIPPSKADASFRFGVTISAMGSSSSLLLGNKKQSVRWDYLQKQEKRLLLSEDFEINQSDCRVSQIKTHNQPQRKEMKTVDVCSHKIFNEVFWPLKQMPIISKPNQRAFLALHFHIIVALVLK